MKKKRFLKIFGIVIVVCFILSHLNTHVTMMPAHPSKRLLLETNHAKVFDDLKQSEHLNTYFFDTSPLRPYQCHGFVYIPDLANDTYKKSVVGRLNNGLDVCFIGTSTIEELESLLDMPLYHCLKINECQEDTQGMNLFYDTTLTFQESTQMHAFPKDLNFDLFIYNISGEDILVASLLSQEKDYKNLFLCIAEETLDHPERYQTSVSGNVQYRFYHDVQDNTYFAYDLSLYHESDPYHQKQAYNYVYHGYFSQNGKTLLSRNDDVCSQKNIHVIPPLTFASGDLENDGESYEVMLGMDKYEKRFKIEASKVLTTHREDDHEWLTVFEKKEGSYGQNDILRPSVHLVVDDLDIKDPLELLDLLHVELEPVFN